ncbi:MAG: peptide chain release factor-like protein [Deltaproteobacteria bacterium]|nr:peptide chain release factor-like protein [Deltaproteobacteria bacterium]
MKTLPVSPIKQKELEERFHKLGLREEDIKEHFVRSSGAGGQNVNKVSTCVVLKYYPKAIAVEGEASAALPLEGATRAPVIEVKCQQTRTQALNRYYARKILCEKLEQKILGEKSAIQQKFEKIRRQKRKRSKRAKEKMLEAKHHQSVKKKTRKVEKGDWEGC